MKFLPKLKKEDTKKIKLISLSLAIFLLTLSLVVSLPKAVTLTESKIGSSGNQPWEKPQQLVTEAQGSEPEIVDQGQNPPQLSAQAALVIDLASEKNLYQKNIHQRLSPASTTKLVTALVAQQHFKSGDILTVPAEALVGGSRMGLQVGETLTFRSLLYGMLLNSGNDAAYTIALNYPGGMKEFISKMNQQATQLNLQNSHFTNPAGFDDPANFSSAHDLLKISQEAIKNPQLTRVVATKETQILSLDKSTAHSLKNLNQLLKEEGVIGIKTGHTDLAGENLITLVERDNHQVLTVILNSQDRFGESKQLIDWIYQNFTWQDSHQ